MRTVRNLAVVDAERCNACALCVRICPTQAISLERLGQRRWLAVVDQQKCLDCTLCATRCPTYAVAMVAREVPIEVGATVMAVSKEAIASVCRSAHMYPDQVICYCHRVRAGEIAAAILQGAETPEEVALATGARTGCGTLCITGVVRLLRAAGIALGKAPGYQWYGIKTSIWEAPLELQAKYPQYRLVEDLQAMDGVFPRQGETR